MIKVVSPPTDRGTKEFTCFNCGCVFQADKWDYEFWNPNCVPGYRIPCPVCKNNDWHSIDQYGHYRGVKSIDSSTGRA